VGFMPGIPVDIQTVLQARCRTESRRHHFSRDVDLTGNRLALDIEQAPDLVVQNRIVEME
jgi:hypothetical protein